MQETIISSLPEACGEMHANVSSDVDVFHFLALRSPKEINYVEIFEVSTNVIFEINAVCRVTACGSPVRGVTLQGFHSCQAQAVQIPVLGVLVHWSVVLEWGPLEHKKFAMEIAHRQH